MPASAVHRLLTKSPGKGAIDTVSPLILLSGPVCAGKTTLAYGLQRRIGIRVLTTRAVLAGHAGEKPEQLDRSRLQLLGEDLDRSTGGSWIVDAIQNLGIETAMVVDAVRTLDQVAAVRMTATALHVHLTAPVTNLEERYAQRVSAQPAFEYPSFAALRENVTEASIERMASFADMAIDTALYGEQATLGRVLHLIANY